MASVVRNTRQSRSVAIRWIAGLLLIVGLGASALILVLVHNEGSPLAQNSQGQALASLTPTAEPTEQVTAEEDNEPSVSNGVETPEATPASTPTTPAPTSTPTTPVSIGEPTPESDVASFVESSSATATPQATSVPESGSSSGSESGSSGSSDDSSESGSPGRSDDSSSNRTDDSSSTSAVQDSSDAAPTAPTSGSGSSRSSTMKIEIPAIGVNAPVEVKSIDSNGVMQNPSSAHAVAWYDFTSHPENKGNAVFAGHLDYAGVGPAVFWELGSVSLGDEVRVTLGNGSVVKYRITGVRSVPADADASDIVAKGSVARITIITCEGSFDPASQNYNQRTIVTGERVG